MADGSYARRLAAGFRLMDDEFGTRDDDDGAFDAEEWVDDDPPEEDPVDDYYEKNT